MKATDCKINHLYRVDSCPSTEYLSVGSIYLCGSSGSTVALHRPQGGGGTYLRRMDAQRVDVSEVDCV